MIITPVKTDKITANKYSVLKLMDKYIRSLKQNSVVAISSLVVSLCEGNVYQIGTADLEKLIKKEADLYFKLNHSLGRFGLTIKNGVFVANSGIDESNSNGYYVLWPKNPQQTANRIRKYLTQRFKLKSVGVIITDSRSIPLRWGTLGVGIAHSGFKALNSYVNKPDIFRRKFVATRLSIVDGLAAAAGVVMGEGAEQTPIVIIENVPFVKFQPRNPTAKEISALKINLEDDLFSPLLKSVSWKRGKVA
jgi:putative folate metabolism gamma-glutamate ligase